MLKKGQPIKFKRPMSSMGVVLSAIQCGHQTNVEIQLETKLSRRQVSGAIENLAFIGEILTGNKNEKGCALYVLPDKLTVGACLKGASSIFNPLV